MTKRTKKCLLFGKLNFPFFVNDSVFTNGAGNVRSRSVQKLGRFVCSLENMFFLTSVNRIYSVSFNIRLLSFFFVRILPLIFSFCAEFLVFYTN